jgi:dermatan/chondrotin sulfate uronyl 2-O-sulfotransferase UST
VVFFNRVPKVGSQTFMTLFHELSEMNGFLFARDPPQRSESIRLPASQQKELAVRIARLRKPAIYIKHVASVNFTRFGLGTPIYVNVVRDPVERMISWFYYLRAPWYYVERRRNFPDLPLPDPEWLRKDFETCVMDPEDQECLYEKGTTHDGYGDHRRQSLFFCGHDKACT